VKLSRETILAISDSILYSYSQIFFAINRFLGLLLLMVTFLDWWVGISGLLAVGVANLTAYLFGYSPFAIRKGLYGFNSLLVGLGIGVYFAFDWRVALLITLSSLATLFITIALEGWLYSRRLPYLSIPFLIVIWLLTASFPYFTELGLNLRSIYLENQLYAIGGIPLVKAYQWFESNVSLPFSLKLYFESLGAIFFQFHVVAGIIIALGLLIHSRQAFIYSLIGFFLAYAFLNWLGVDDITMATSYYGFNFILTAIAIGTFFYVPTWASLVLVVVSILVLALSTVGLANIMSMFHLPVYSLPFNFIVLTVLFALRLRHKQGRLLFEPPVQLKNPEQNAYFYLEKGNDFFSLYLNAGLPVLGKWTINQGFDGKYTHKGDWRFAWDFVIVDSQGKEFKSTGLKLEDYYCYNKPVVAVADGTVVEIADGIEDNPVGEVNTRHNWGNSIVVSHGYGIYSQYSHLKKGSIKVKRGEIVKKGQIIAHVGNSGRSQYPHLHFQFQPFPTIGSKTIRVPFSNYLEYPDGIKAKFVPQGFPQEKQIISNIDIIPEIQKALSFPPQTTLTGTMTINNKKTSFYIIADIDIMNNPYLKCLDDGSVMYFRNLTPFFRSINFHGKKSSPLFFLFNALYFVPYTVSKGTVFHASMPVYINHPLALLLLQDITINLFKFLETKYFIKVVDVDNILKPTFVSFHVEIINLMGQKTINKSEAMLKLAMNGKSTLQYTTGRKTIQLEWEKGFLY